MFNQEGQIVTQQVNIGKPWTPPDILLDTERGLTRLIGRQEYLDGTTVMLPALRYLRDKLRERKEADE